MPGRRCRLPYHGCRRIPRQAEYVPSMPAVRPQLLCSRAMRANVSSSTHSRQQHPRRWRVDMGPWIASREASKNTDTNN